MYDSMVTIILISAFSLFLKIYFSNADEGLEKYRTMHKYQPVFDSSKVLFLFLIKKLVRVLTPVCVHLGFLEYDDW